MQTIIELYQNLSYLQIIILALSAILIGINKSGIPGISVVPVVLLTLSFEPGLATGMLLIMMCMGDLIALSFYRKVRPDWVIILKLLPFAILGILLGSLTLHKVGDAGLRPMIGWIIIGLTMLKFANDHWTKSSALPASIWMSTIFGLLAGFTTQIANAAGPIVALFLLALKLPSKEKYISTCVWLFLILNYIKLPIFITEERIGSSAFTLVLPMLGFVLIGGALGVIFMRKIPRKHYETTIEITIIIASIRLLFM